MCATSYAPYSGLKVDFRPEYPAYLLAPLARQEEQPHNRAVLTRAGMSPNQTSLIVGQHAFARDLIRRLVRPDNRVCIRQPFADRPSEKCA